MTVVALIVLPIVLLYQSWTYYVFRARLTRRGARVRPRRSRERPAADACASSTSASCAGPAPVRHLLVLDAVARCPVRAARPRPGGAAREDRGAGVRGRVAERRRVRPRPARARVRRPGRPGVGLRGRRPPRRVDGPLRASARARGAPAPDTAGSRSTAPRPARSPPPRCRASTGSRPTSPATCRRSCSRASCRSPCSASSSRSTRSRPR